MAIFATSIVLAVLTMFGYIQPIIERYRKAIELHITFSGDEEADVDVEKTMGQCNLKFEKIRTIKREGDAILLYEVSGPKKQVDLFLQTLNRNKAIRSYEY